jgi:prevent-host-death family protein
VFHQEPAIKTVNIHEAKTQLSKLVERVRAGEEIILAKAGEPVARIVPYVQSRSPRKPGALKGKIRIGKDFDAPLPDELLAAFQGTVEQKRKPEPR